MDSYINSIIRKKNLLAHVSIWTIAAIVLTISLTLFRGTLFGIIYLIFFLAFVLTFQSSYSLWARSIRCYCFILLLYSTCITLLTYSFQYSAINSIYKSNLSEQVLNDIGLVVRNSGWLLFLEPFIPLLLTMFLFIFLRIFQDDFNRFIYLAEENDISLSTPLTGQQLGAHQTINDSTYIMLSTTSVSSANNNLGANNNLDSTTSIQHNNHRQSVSRQTSLATANQANITSSKIDLRKASRSAKIQKFLKAANECFWRILETHFIKLVAFMIFRLPVNDVCLMNVPFLIIVIFALKYPSAAKCSCLTASWLISFIVVIRNLSNLTLLRKYDLTRTCDPNPPYNFPVPLAGNTYSFLNYIGINHDIDSPLNQVDNHIIVLILITIYSFICIHYQRRSVKDHELSFGVIFEGIGRREADLGIINGFKYFCNFGFYKFGIELTCLTLIIAISNRLDSLAAIYGIILILISICTSKRTLSRIWPVLNILVSLIIPIQYMLRLGLPRALCKYYPWQDWSPDFKYWLFLPDYVIVQDSSLLLFDFLVLLAMCRQTIVFKHMSINLNPCPFITGGNQMHHEFSAHQFRVRYLPDIEEYATEDCFTNYTTQSNYLKSIFFISIYWITLAVVLSAGATKISLFSLGYLIGCFIFLWQGNDTYLMPLPRLIFNWNWFIFYAALVIFTKVILQLYACYLHEYLLSHCYILQLLRVVCYRKMSLVPSNEQAKTCAESLPYDELDILWDGLCLMFLLMQRVVFGSQYFRYLVQEVKAQQILASRGAELIMATQIEEAKAQAMYEKEVMRSVREKMEDLKSENAEVSNAWRRLLTFPHHHQVIRNANKHIFSESNDDDSVCQSRTNNWKFRKPFIPDPIGDELERMSEINGINAVFSRWMKGLPLYGTKNSNYPSQATNSPTTINNETTTSPQALSDDDSNDSPSPTTNQQQQQQTVVKSKKKDSHDQVQHEELELCSFDAPPSKPPSDVADQELDDEEGSEEMGRMRGCWDMLNLVMYSCLLSATVELNKLSRSYRYVSRRMAVEKNILKRQFNLNDERFKNDPTWRKWVISTLSDTYVKSNEHNQGAQSNTSLHRIRSALKVIASSSNNGGSQVSAASNDGSESKSPPTNGATSTIGGDGKGGGGGGATATLTSQPRSQTSRAELTDPEYYFLKLNMFTQFCRALLYVFISNTSLLCQIVIIFNQILTASLLSLPLPLLTFLWGTLSVPRPTKRFWKTVITYTELVIVIKYVCQFPLWDWDVNNLNPYYFPNLLGIKNITILYDLSLLLALFLHRSMLKSLGQWDASAKEELPPFDIDKTTPNSGDSLPTSHHLSRKAKRSSKNGDGRNGDNNQLKYKKQDMSQERYTQSCQLDDSTDSTTELAPRVISSIEIDRTQAYNDYLQDSYQGKFDSPNEMDTNQQVSVLNNNSCCGPCARLYNRIHRSIAQFFQHVLNTPYKVQTDVYTWMFLCDFINFLILIYGFGAFGGGYTNQTVASFLNENRIPFSVLIMLLFQFASIMIDRAFYLQKNIGGKLAFQVVLVIGIHVWLFFALPFTTGHTLTLKEYWPPKAWYVIKCIYFLLSSHQIRSGYPRRVLGNCFTNGYGYANWGAFKVYRALPLVYDLRLYMDWIWTETTLEFRNWSLMEDMFANLFIRKCELTLEEEYPLPRAKPIRHFSKYLTGGAFILLILAIIWGPLLLFSMGKTVGQSNPPVEVEYELEFVGFQPLLRMRATAQQITLINEDQYNKFKDVYKSLSDQSFLGDYKVGDVSAIRLDGQSNAVWEISPPSKEVLMNSIKNNETLTIKSSWTLFRIKREKSQNFDVNIAGSYQNVIGSNTTDETKFRNDLYDMLASSSTTKTPPNEIKSVITPAIFPNFLRVPETGQVSLVGQFEEAKQLRPLSLAYIRMFDSNINQIDNSTSWWRADDLCKTNISEDTYSFWTPEILPHCDSLFVVAFNDRIFTGLLALLSAPGIIGLYTTFVVFFARLIRTEPSGKVIYTEIPKVDRVYGLIMDIYMMRECGEFELEEKLFAKLLFLYRSPEMLIDWSRRDEGSSQVNVNVQLE